MLIFSAGRKASHFNMIGTWQLKEAIQACMLVRVQVEWPMKDWTLKADEETFDVTGMGAQNRFSWGSPNRANKYPLCCSQLVPISACLFHACISAKGRGICGVYHWNFIHSTKHSNQKCFPNALKKERAFTNWAHCCWSQGKNSSTGPPR